MAAKMYRSTGAAATGSDRRVRRGSDGGANVAARLLREPGLLGDLGGEIVLLLLEALAELEPHEPADLDVLADLGDLLLLELVDRLVGVLDPRLIEQTDLLEPLGDLAVDHLLH